MRAEPRGTAACTPGSARAIIAGKPRCLRSGYGCAIRRDRLYHRYGFHCHDGVLEQDLWRPLRRRLRVPRLVAGATCPRTAARQLHEAWGVALADGPPYPLPFAGGIADLRAFPPAADGWWAWKTIWIAPPGFTGPVLVRGRRLDGPGELRFSAQPLMLVRELRLLFSQRFSDRWQEGVGPRYTRIPSPGCYAFQVDTRQESRVVVFEATA